MELQLELELGKSPPPLKGLNTRQFYENKLLSRQIDFDVPQGLPPQRGMGMGKREVAAEVAANFACVIASITVATPAATTAATMSNRFMISLSL